MVINNEQVILRFIDTLPDTNLIVGYGSGVILQDGYQNNSKTQIDLIVGTPNPRIFHQQLIKEHKEYYPKFISRPYLTYKSEKDYNSIDNVDCIPYIKFEDKLFKLTVVNYDNILQNCLTWKNLIIPGRFHKPIIVFQGNDQFNKSNDYNRLQALKLALLLMKDNSLEELIRTICQLSYIGTPRMILFENPNKVRNIMSFCLEELKSIYKKDDVYVVEQDNVIFDERKVISSISDYMKQKFSIDDKMSLSEIQKKINNGLYLQNFTDELRMSFNGVFTAGETSPKYMFAKLEKKISK